MSRIRTIKPEFWRDEELNSLPEATHMLAAALLNYADDEGYFNANVGLIKGDVLPLRDPSVTIHDSLIALSNIGYLKLGTGPCGKRYGHIVNFLKHQVINRAKPSKIKDLEICWDESRSDHGSITEVSSPEQGTGNREQDITSPSGDDEFENWYATYPRHVGKGQARKAYRTARGKTDAQTLLDGVARYRDLKPDYADWAHPATWLNGERWMDEGGEVEQPLTAEQEAALASVRIPEPPKLVIDNDEMPELPAFLRRS